MKILQMVGPVHGFVVDPVLDSRKVLVVLVVLAYTVELESLVTQLEEENARLQKEQDDVPESSLIDGFCLRYRWYRIQSDRKVAIRNAWQHHRTLHERASSVVNENGTEEEELFGRFNTSGSGASNQLLPKRSGGETWFEVGRLKTYTPIANDIGHVPKFECVSFDAEKKLHVGHANTILTSHVIPPPTPCPRCLVPVNGVDVMGNLDLDGRTFRNLYCALIQYSVRCDNVALIAVLEAKFSNHRADTPGKRQLLCVELCFFLRIHNGTWDLLREAFHLTLAAPIFLRSSLCFTPKHDSYVTPHFEYVIMRFADLFQKWRLYCLVFGILSMLFAPILSDWVPFYYTSSMAVGVLLVVLFLLFQNIEIHFEDWNIGILGHVVLHGVDQGRRDLTWQKWSYQVGLKGEAVNLVSPSGVSSVEWTRGSLVMQRQQPLTWYKSYFSAPNGEGPLALDMGIIGKGQIWINGHKVFNNASCYLLFRIMVQKLLLW
ncbi:hypothetical protein IFM89_016994 [Coptis chinensis]|uniref:Beta-galactosidase galactose-binding domain-containing protein n=1 Tax=Coptis chinensis TaxID=261450 RepID=A0A835I3Z2_9MAGN|nr:hypothetical protein IFM89_016994 [Coptis chinensis]